MVLAPVSAVASVLMCCGVIYLLAVRLLLPHWRRSAFKLVYMLSFVLEMAEAPDVSLLENCKTFWKLPWSFSVLLKMPV